MRQEIINFLTTASSGANKTLASKRIDVPYHIKSIRLYFDTGANNTVKVSPFISLDAETPTGAKPEGVNFISEFSQADYFLGDHTYVSAKINHKVKEQGTYLKLYIENSAATTPYIYCQIIIEIDDQI